MKTLLRSQNSLRLMSAFYILAGIGHFAVTEIYLAAMPLYLPYPLELVYLSGLIEIALGILLLFPKTRKWAAWGVIALLIAVLPAHVHLILRRGEPWSFPMWILWLRQPLQLVFMYWAWGFTQDLEESRQLSGKT